MASAAERVLSITEILEPILIDCNFNTNELFQLQTLSRYFNHTINGSKPLLMTMEILHKPPDQKRYRVSNPILWFQQLELAVKSYKVQVLAPQSPHNDGSGWKMNLRVTLDLNEDPSKASGKKVGVKSSQFTHPLDGSWRRMKMTRFPVVVAVPMYITYSDITYEETTTDPSGEMTLGDLADLVKHVRSRDEEQHRTAAAESQRKTRVYEASIKRRAENGGCRIM